MSYLIAVCSAMLVAAVHYALFRMMYYTESGVVRGLLMTAKLLLWAGFFVCMGLIGHHALLVGAAASSVLYLAVGLYWLKRMRERLTDDPTRMRVPDPATGEGTWRNGDLWSDEDAPRAAQATDVPEATDPPDDRALR